MKGALAGQISGHDAAAIAVDATSVHLTDNEAGSVLKLSPK